MAKPKKWHLHRDEKNRIILNYSNGPVKKPNGDATYGPILKVSVPTEEGCGKLTREEALLVSALAD